MKYYWIRHAAGAPEGVGTGRRRQSRAGSQRAEDECRVFLNSPSKAGTCVYANVPKYMMTRKVSETAEASSTLGESLRRLFCC